MSRICREVELHLPAYADGSLAPWRRWLVDRHLRRCEDCRAVLEEERAVAAALAALGPAAQPSAEDLDPPDALLESLLERAHRPGVRARVAVPARGAVSGARPVLSVALLVAGAAVGTAAGWASWRGTRAVRARVVRRR